MPNISDVAKLAGVSIATVSNHINGTKPVRQATADRVRAAMEALAFMPDSNARNLRMRASREIAIILPDIGDPYYADIFRGADNFLSETGYEVFAAFTENQPEKEARILDMVIQKKVAGIILATCQPESFASFRNIPMPVVLIDREIPGSGFPVLSFNNRASVYSLTSELIAQGCINIALFTGPAELSCEKEAVTGYADALNDSGHFIDKALIQSPGMTREDAFRSAVLLFHQKHIDACIASSEPILEGVLEAASLRGEAFMSGLRFASLGQEYWHRHERYEGVTRIKRPAFDMGRKAADMLTGSLSAKCQKVILDPEAQSSNVHKPESIFRPLKSGTSISVTLLDTAETRALEGLSEYFSGLSGVKPVFRFMAQGELLDNILSDRKYGDSDTDIYMFDIPWLEQLAFAGCLEDISRYMLDTGFDASRFLPGCLSHYSINNGKYYGVPFLYSPQLLFYRRDLFENKSLSKEYESRSGAKLRPPRTWHEFNSIAAFFTKGINPNSPTVYGTSVAMATREVLMPELLIRMWSAGGDLFDGNRVILESVNNIRAVESFLETLKYSPREVCDQTIEKTVSDFCSEQIPMIVTYASFMTKVNNRLYSDVAGKAGFSPIPGRTPVLGGWSLGISPFSRKKDESFRFIDAACGTEAGAYYMILEGQSPILSLYSSNDLVKLYPWLPLLLETYGSCRARKSARCPSGGIIPRSVSENIVSESIYDTISGQLSTEEALRRAGQALKALCAGL